ncbi:helix-turn-helix domain-containing protein [Dyadobacter bucti]|uniref:helix-turn-helix domain-containing protein n=1 Tax=Dyadobacter bucti TaxID=2572203 RepID=UPI003F70E768
MKKNDLNISLAERLLRLERQLSECLSSHQSKTNCDRYLNITEAADLLCKSVHTVYGMVSRREIPHIKNGNRLLFKEADLIDWVEKGRRQTTTEMIGELKLYSKPSRS